MYFFFSLPNTGFINDWLPYKYHVFKKCLTRLETLPELLFYAEHFKVLYFLKSERVEMALIVAKALIKCLRWCLH